MPFAIAGDLMPVNLAGQPKEPNPMTEIDQLLNRMYAYERSGHQGDGYDVTLAEYRRAAEQFPVSVALAIVRLANAPTNQPMTPARQALGPMPPPRRAV